MRYAVLLAWLLLLVVGVWLLRETTTEVQPGLGDGVEADGLDVAPLTPVAGAVVSGGGGERVVGKPSRWQDQILGTNEVGEPILPDYWFADIVPQMCNTNLDMALRDSTNWANVPKWIQDFLLATNGAKVPGPEGEEMVVDEGGKRNLVLAQLTDGFLDWPDQNVPPGYHGHPHTGVVMKGKHDDATCPVR